MKSKTKIKNTKGWNPFVGCNFDCKYCKDSFGPLLQMVGRTQHCQQCYDYIPHTHPHRLLQKLPSERVIFVASNGDISFCDPAFVDQIVDVMRKDRKEGRVFLLQSKNPACFSRILNRLPRNVVLMTTIESNRHYPEVSKAPSPSQRFKDFLKLDWPRKAMVMEPILKFELEVVLRWARELKPEAVFIGLESKRRCILPEPSDAEVETLHRELQDLGFKTYDKAQYKYRDVF